MRRPRVRRFPGQTEMESKETENRQVTIKDIARESGISYSTVSRALSQDPKVSALVAAGTRKRVQKVAVEMDYNPNLIAQGIVKGRTSTMGLLTYEISREPFGTQADHILRAADKHKYQVLIAMGVHLKPGIDLDDEVRQIRQLLSRRVDGLFIHTRGDSRESERIRGAVRGRVPVVTFCHPTPDLSGVVVDERAGFFEATEHLIRLGHERIGFIGTRWDRNVQGSAKAKGYMLAMRKHGLTPSRIPGKTFPAMAMNRLGEWLGDRFTALVCRNDYTALCALRGLREAGYRIPENVAVIGSGDIGAGAYLTPALTTIEIPHEELAREAMELMLEQLRGQDDRRQATLKSRLVVRESCGANTDKLPPAPPS